LYPARGTTDVLAVVARAAPVVAGRSDSSIASSMDGVRYADTTLVSMRYETRSVLASSSHITRGETYATLKTCALAASCAVNTVRRNTTS
jgi:hypothetical protein